MYTARDKSKGSITVDSHQGDIIKTDCITKNDMLTIALTEFKYNEKNHPSILTQNTHDSDRKDVPCFLRILSHASMFVWFFCASFDKLAVKI